MVFSKPLREGIRRGRITCTIRFWIRPHVRVGGRYPFEDGHIVVDSLEAIDLADVTEGLAGESGFGSLDDLLDTARHGKGENIYLIRFHYLRPGSWDEDDGDATPGRQAGGTSSSSATLLQRIRSTTPPAVRQVKKGGLTGARTSRGRAR